MKNNIIVLDCETGGLKSDENPITQIGLSVIEPIHFAELNSYETFVKPYDDLVITKAALEKSRVSMKEINAGIPIEKLLKQLLAIFKEATGRGRISKPILAGHNFGFDIGFLEYIFLTRNLNLFEYVDTFHYDTQRLYSHLEAEQKNADKYQYNLTALCDRHGIMLTAAHGAMADVIATRELLVKYLNRLRDASGDNKSSGSKRESSSGGVKSRATIAFEF